MDQQTFALAEKIWDYHLMKHQVAKADAILVLCSHDERVAERGAQLFLAGWAPLIIFSGGQGAITRNLWSEPEAERFARIANSLGVPGENILIEQRPGLLMPKKYLKTCVHFKCASSNYQNA